MLNGLHGLQLNEGTRQDIVTKFVVGRETLKAAEVKHILQFLDRDFPRPGCSAGTCERKLTAQYHSSYAKIMDPVDCYQRWCDENPTLVGNALDLCAVCHRSVEESIKKGRERIWETLPEMFGLPGWDTLVAENDVGEDSSEEDG